MTGVVNLDEELTSRQLQLLKTNAPGTSHVGVLTTGTAIIYGEALRDATGAASALNLKLVEVRTRPGTIMSERSIQCVARQDQVHANILTCETQPDQLPSR